MIAPLKRFEQCVQVMRLEVTQGMEMTHTVLDRACEWSRQRTVAIVPSHERKLCLHQILGHLMLAGYPASESPRYILRSTPLVTNSNITQYPRYVEYARLIRLPSVTAACIGPLSLPRSRLQPAILALVYTVFRLRQLLL